VAQDPYSEGKIMHVWRSGPVIPAASPSIALTNPVIGEPARPLRRGKIQGIAEGIRKPAEGLEPRNRMALMLADLLPC
jgi:hypothetical protein